MFTAYDSLQRSISASATLKPATDSFRRAAMFVNLARIVRRFLILACVCSGIWAAPAQASFHLYQIVQMYSNADGTVQYVELFTGAGGQNFLGGFTLVSSSGGTTHSTFNIPSSLTGNTANTHVLFATQGFANLGIATPDYIIPAGFLVSTGGSVNYAGVDSVSFASLPTNGNAIARDGSATTPAPTNFAGQTGSLSVATFTPQGGFWWNPAEGGRGYVIEIHGSTLFIGGFMYDGNGNAIWYGSGPGAMVDFRTYVNVWQQYGNGVTLTGSYKPAIVVNPNVGALTIQFTSATDGKLTLPNGTQIPITRFPF
jgi:hypothetical protein